MSVGGAAWFAAAGARRLAHCARGGRGLARAASGTLGRARKVLHKDCYDLFNSRGTEAARCQWPARRHKLENRACFCDPTLEKRRSVCALVQRCIGAR